RTKPTRWKDWSHARLWGRYFLPDVRANAPHHAPAASGGSRDRLYLRLLRHGGGAPERGCLADRRAFRDDQVQPAADQDLRRLAEDYQSPGQRSPAFVRLLACHSPPAKWMRVYRVVNLPSPLAGSVSSKSRWTSRKSFPRR